MKTKKKKKRVLVFGTFDLLHAGHLHYLEKAKKFGEELFVIIARDKTAKRIKGRKPVMDENQRLKIISALRIVDKAVLGCRGNMYRRIKDLSPNIICLGYDQKPSSGELKKELKKLGVKARIMRLKKFVSKGFHSSTQIKKKILKQKKCKKLK